MTTVRPNSRTGGLLLSPDKHHTLSLPILDMPLPRQLRYPLGPPAARQRIPVVRVGEQVVQGQTLAVSPRPSPAHTNLVPLLASAVATVTRIDEDSLTLVPDNPTETAHTPISSITDREAEPPASRTALVRAIYHGAIQGLGGAGYASAMKLAALKNRPLTTLVINAAECEPMVCCDQALMGEHPDALATAIITVFRATGAKRCLIGTEQDKRTEAVRLRESLQRRTRDNVHIEILPNWYPTGDERTLIRLLTGDGVARKSLPQHQGIVCFNLQTVMAIARLLILGEPMLSRVLTVTGDQFRQPRNVRAWFGTPVDELLSFVRDHDTTAGPRSDRNGDIRGNAIVIIGGPMTGEPMQHHNRQITASSNCVIHRSTHPGASLPCISCGRCHQVCPAALAPARLYHECRADQLTQAVRSGIDECLLCGCCDHVCPSEIALTGLFRLGKAAVREQRRQDQLASTARDRHEHRQARLARREAARKQRLEQRKQRLQTDKRQATLDATLERVQRRRHGVTDRPAGKPLSTTRQDRPGPAASGDDESGQGTP